MALTRGQLRQLHSTPLPDSGNRIEQAMELLKLTQAQLAEAIDVRQQYISDVCRGRHSTITLANAQKFSEFFGCAIEDLFPARQEVA